jgi:hypothetical protein
MEHKLQKLMARAQERGDRVAAETWERKLVELKQRRAEQVVWHTREVLVRRGWCLWQCSVLGDQTIVVAREQDRADIEAKLQTGARVISAGDAPSSRKLSPEEKRWS